MVWTNIVYLMKILTAFGELENISNSLVINLSLNTLNEWFFNRIINCREFLPKPKAAVAAPYFSWGSAEAFSCELQHYRWPSVY